MKAGWGVTDIPDLTGRTAIVTGASGGIGYEIAAVLAARMSCSRHAARTAGSRPEC